MEDNPWTRLNSRIVYENPWIRVREDAVIRPDGAEGIYGVVQTRLATGVIALTENDEVYLVGQYRYTMGCYSWEIIEGGSEPDETALEAAQREMREETGLVADNWRRLGGEIHLTNCHSDERGYLFVATGLHPGPSNPEGTEALQVRTVPFSEAVAMVDRGEIQDAISIMALLRLDRERRTAPGN